MEAVAGEEIGAGPTGELDPLIDVRRLSKCYEDADGSLIPALTEASFTCRPGEIYGLLGPNGAGKTTALRCLAGVLAPTSGDAIVAGLSVVSNPQAVRGVIGYHSTTIQLYPRLTPRETLRLFASLHGLNGERLEQRVEETLELFAIGEYADRPNDRLSTGMKQRVNLGRAAVHDPPVLILDEPTNGLDPVVSRSVERAVLALAKAGKCVLFSTHLLHQAQELCDRLGLIVAGRVVAEGTPAELMDQTGAADLRGAFFALVDSEATEGLRED